MSLRPRNSDELDSLERAAAGLLAAMVTGALRAGQMPPKDILAWYTGYCTEALIATESMAQQIGHDTPAEDVEAIGAQLQTCVLTLSDLLRHLNGNKQLVLVDKVMSALRARALHLPVDFDTTYEGVLPRV